MTTHTHERPFQCQHCDTNYSFLSALISHKNIKHLGKRYPCKLCPSTYSHPSNLSIHTRRKHYSQSKRAILNGIRKITKDIGILKGKKNQMEKVVDEMDPEAVKDSKMPVVTKTAVPTTSQLFNLVNSLQKVTQRKRKINGEEQVPENGVSVKHRKQNGGSSLEENKTVLPEVKEEIAKENEEAAVEIKEEKDDERKNEAVVAVTEEVTVEEKVETVEKEHVEEVENVTEPLVTTSTSEQNDDLVIGDIFAVKQEKEEDKPPLSPQQNTSVPLTNEKLSTNELKKTSSQATGKPVPSTSSYPSLTRVPFVVGPPQQPPYIPCWHRPPDPPPNLMFHFNGHTVPVLSLELLRSFARPNYQTVPLPTSPPSSQSSLSDPDSDYTPPRPSTSSSSRKQSTTSSKSGQKKSGPEKPSTKIQRQSVKMQDKKTAKSRTKSSSKTTATTTTATTKPQRAAYQSRNYQNKCEHCGATFRFPCKLVAHMVMHTGEKPFSCTFCGGRFSRKVALHFIQLINLTFIILVYFEILKKCVFNFTRVI